MIGFLLAIWINHNLNSDITGFQKADQLWSSLQSKMANFIINNGGQAEYYSQPSIKARPFWNEVREYLKGNIDFPTLKKRLGC